MATADANAAKNNVECQQWEPTVHARVSVCGEEPTSRSTPLRVINTRRHVLPQMDILERKGTQRLLLSLFHFLFTFSVETQTNHTFYRIWYKGHIIHADI